MRSERLFRFGGLALVLLFPLLSVLQLGDASHPWRAAAQQVRPSVVGLYDGGDDGTGPAFVACGVVLDADPPRLVVPGRISGFPLRSRHPDGWIHWRVLLADVEGEFSVLQADSFHADPNRRTPTDLSLLVAPARMKPDPEGQPATEVEVALVAPPELPDQPLWVGVLVAETSSTGRASYTSSFLHPVEDVGTLSASSAHAAREFELAPALRGAPFVDADGNAVAIYVGRNGRGMRALAVETVIQSLLMMHLQAAK